MHFDSRLPHSELDSSALDLAKHVRDLLAQHSVRLVLAESCTAGRVAATLAVLPGISQWLCGSFVVYRSASKTAWLQVPDSLLSDPHIGPVSPQASRVLAAAALTHTPEANMAIAVTGDVGPGAPESTDGRVFLACATRLPPASESVEVERQILLRSPTPINSEDIPARYARLEEATQAVLQFAIEQLTATGR